jgi:hypothetical protein
LMRRPKSGKTTTVIEANLEYPGILSEPRMNSLNGNT